MNDPFELLAFNAAMVALANQAVTVKTVLSKI